MLDDALKGTGKSWRFDNRPKSTINRQVSNVRPKSSIRITTDVDNRKQVFQFGPMKNSLTPVRLMNRNYKNTNTISAINATFQGHSKATNQFNSTLPKWLKDQTLLSLVDTQPASIMNEELYPSFNERLNKIRHERENRRKL